MEDSVPAWKKNKKVYNRQYDKDHSVRFVVRVYRDTDELKQIWETIPNKAQWFSEALKEYDRKNNSRPD